MAAYCRVSTDQEEQLLSYENQLNYYTGYINNNPLYQFAGIYADEGISGTNTKKRDEFNKMIADCRSGKIDMIITKSISRFARNTLDCLNYVRELKDLGIGIIFEKEYIQNRLYLAEPLNIACFFNLILYIAFFRTHKSRYCVACRLFVA